MLIAKFLENCLKLVAFKGQGVILNFGSYKALGLWPKTAGVSNIENENHQAKLDSVD